MRNENRDKQLSGPRDFDYLAMMYVIRIHGSSGKERM